MLINDIFDVKSITIKQYSKNVRLQWLFSTSNTIPKNGKIKIVLDNGSNWDFVVLVSIESRCILRKQTGDFEDKNCVVSINSASKFILFTFSSPNNFDPGNYKLI